MTHYELLGVSPVASAADARNAYLAAARRAHPDVAGPAGDVAMRELNSAWAVLSDAEARALYDLTLAGEIGGTARPHINRPVDRPFVPYNPDDEDDDDEWRYVDDVTDPATAPSAALQFIPICVVVFGLAIAGAGAILRTAEILTVGIIFVLLGGVGFLIVPLMVMSKASTVEHRRQRGRRS